jgi:hypothetical protein
MDAVPYRLAEGTSMAMIGKTYSFLASNDGGRA